MRKPRTDFTGWTQEQIREHRNRNAREEWAKHPEKGRARGKRYYVSHRAEKLAREADRFHADPERRRAIVRKSRHRNPGRTLLESARQRAAKFGLPFTLTQEWFQRTYKGKCELTGIDFTSTGRLTGKISPFAPSLDQIVPKGGYTPENVQIILWAINRFKGDMPFATMIMIARALVDRA